MLKNYFDGGNQADSETYKVLTLAALAGEQSAWGQFENDWALVLKEHKAPYLHTTDAISLANPFSKRNGWNGSKVEGFIGDCVGVLAQCKRWKIALVSVSIVLADYKAFQLGNPDVPPVERQCAINCVGLCLLCGQTDLAHRKAELFFDRGEPFCGHMLDLWNNKKFKRSNDTLNSIVHIGQSDMKAVPALQAADLLAWSINHKNGAPLYEWQARALKLQRLDRYFDKNTLLNPNATHLEKLKALRLPRRKKMR